MQLWGCYAKGGFALFGYGPAERCKACVVLEQQLCPAWPCGRRPHVGRGVGYDALTCLTYPACDRATASVLTRSPTDLTAAAGFLCLLQPSTFSDGLVGGLGVGRGRPHPHMPPVVAGGGACVTLLSIQRCLGIAATHSACEFDPPRLGRLWSCRQACGVRWVWVAGWLGSAPWLWTMTVLEASHICCSHATANATQPVLPAR